MSKKKINIKKYRDLSSKQENFIYNFFKKLSKKNKSFNVKRHVIIPIYTKRKKIKEQKNVDVVVQYNNVRTLIEYDGITHKIVKYKKLKDRRFEYYIKKKNLRLIRINARRFRNNKEKKIKKLLDLIKDTSQTGVIKI